MFQNCNKLTALDVSKFNTTNVTAMNGMFYGCSNLTTLDVSNFNTTKVTNMSYMFGSCNTDIITSINALDTSNVINMSSMFNGCKGTTLDLTNFNTSKVTDMSYMFTNSTYKNIINIENLNVDNLTSLNGTFSGMKNLESLKIENWNPAKLTTIGYGWDLYAGMFNGFNCPSIKTIDLSNWDCPNINSFLRILCKSNIETFKMPKIYPNKINYSDNASFLYVFDGMSTKYLYLNNWDVSDINIIFKKGLLPSHDISLGYTIYVPDPNDTKLDIASINNRGWNIA